MVDEFIKLLDKDLNYLFHEIINDTLYIHVESGRSKVICPYCGQSSSKVHSKYRRKFQDLPMLGKKTSVILHNRKYFCLNSECSRKTFAESFQFIPIKARKIQRLTEQIMDISLNMSSIAATTLLRENVVNIGKSTICNLIKKNTDDR